MIWFEDKSISPTKSLEIRTFFIRQIFLYAIFRLYTLQSL
jgi:hypothetical protein